MRVFVKRDNLAAAGLLLCLPLASLILSTLFLAVSGGFGADPDYAYLLNGLNILHLESPGHADHPGTPLQLLGGAVIGTSWLVRSIALGGVALDDDVLRHPEIYLTCINALLALMAASALWFFGRQVWSWTGSLAAALVGQITLLLSPPVLISLPRVTPEPLLISLTILLAALFAPSISRPWFPWHHLRSPILVGATLGACIATKITAAPLILMVALLRGVRMQLVAVAMTIVVAIVLTLPVVALYGSFLNWLAALAFHSRNYGEGAVGMPPLSDLLDHLRLLLASFPGAFVSVAVCVTMLAWGQLIDDRPRLRLFAICALVISIEIFAVAKNYSLRYALPVAAVAALANAGAVYVAAPRRGAARLGFVAVLIALLTLGTWSTTLTISQWYRVPYAIARENDAVLAKATLSGCTMIPYYGASSPEFNLHFGNRLAKRIYARRLAAIYPDFMSYDSGRFEDFIDVIEPAEAERRMSTKKCIYLFGSPIERFNDFGIPARDLTPIARSSGGLGDALAIYQVSPAVVGQLKPIAR
jgi:hypothetical protein